MFELYTTGDVVGCGIDWDADEVFFVKNATSSLPKTQVMTVSMTWAVTQESWHPAVDKLERKSWYPAVGNCPSFVSILQPLMFGLGTTLEADSVRINTGQEPFLFDVKEYIKMRRAGALEACLEGKTQKFLFE